MSENSGDKGFKTLKLTTLKTASPGQPTQGAPLSSGAEPAPAPPPLPESAPVPVVAPTPVPESKSVASVPPLAASAPAPVAPAARPVPKPASLNLMSFKSGAAKKESAGEQSPPPSAASTPPPALSPSAASSGPSLKPFKVLTPTTKPEERTASGDQTSVKPQEIKLTKAGESGFSSVESTPALFPETARSAPASVGVPLPDSLTAAPAGKSPLSLSSQAKTGSDKAEAGEQKKAPVAQASRKPLLIVLGLVFALIVVAGVGAYLALSKKGQGEGVKTPAASTPSTTEPVKTPSTVTDTAATTTPTVEPNTASSIEPSPSDTPATAGPVVAPRTRNPEAELWLRNAVVTAVSTQRVTLNGKVFTLNSVVSSTGNLRWIGRDTVTRDLLFMDDAGVIYNKPLGGSAK